MDGFADAPGARLFYRDEGAGPPIVLIHAAIADQRSWDEMVPALVAAGYRTVRYDLRGFGRSTTEAVEFDPIDDLLAVLDATGIERAAVVGNSWGGMIGTDAAIVHPDRIVGLVTIGSGLGGYEPGVTAEEAAIFDEGDRLLARQPRDAEAVAEFLVRFWVDGICQTAGRAAAPIREQIREVCRAQYDPAHVEGAAKPLEPPAVERLSELHCPVLAVAGDLDVSDTAATARHLEQDAPNARAVILAGAAHMIGMEKPDELAALVLDFLAPLRPW